MALLSGGMSILQTTPIYIPTYVLEILHVHMWTYVCMYDYDCITVCMYVCMYVRMHICTHVCMYACIYVYLYCTYVS